MAQWGPGLPRLMRGGDVQPQQPTITMHCTASPPLLPQDMAVVGHDEEGKPLTFKHPAVQVRLSSDGRP